MLELFQQYDQLFATTASWPDELRVVQLVHRLHLLDEVVKHSGLRESVRLEHLDSDGHQSTRGGTPLSSPHHTERPVTQLRSQADDHTGKDFN